MCSILNLTRKVLPSVSKIPQKNIEAVNSIPEMVLRRMMRDGAQNIVYCDMNHSAAAVISPEGINTIFTDGLSGCNFANIITKLKDKRFLSISSHYVPTNRSGQIAANEKQLKIYTPHLDTSYKPRVFFNIKNDEKNPNMIVENFKALLNKFFPQGYKIEVTPYQSSSHPFASTANITQFDPADISKIKITNVGEKERFIDLNI